MANRRLVAALVPLLLAGCATAAMIDRSFDVLVVPESPDTRAGTFEITLVNRTDGDRCVPREAFELPHSYAVHAALRIGDRSVPFAPEGYLVDPGVYGNRRLAPGERVSFRTHFRGRFVRDFDSLGRDAEVRVGVTHYPCSPDATIGDGRASWSRWTAIRPPRAGT